MALAHDGLTQTARMLIDRSTSHDEIVHHPWSAGLAVELLEASDGTAEGAEVVEFWGADGDAPAPMTWRIHLDRLTGR